MRPRRGPRGQTAAAAGPACRAAAAKEMPPPRRPPCSAAALQRSFASAKSEGSTAGAMSRSPILRNRLCPPSRAAPMARRAPRCLVSPAGAARSLCPWLQHRGRRRRGAVLHLTRRWPWYMSRSAAAVSCAGRVRCQLQVQPLSLSRAHLHLPDSSRQRGWPKSNDVARGDCDQQLTSREAGSGIPCNHEGQRATASTLGRHPGAPSRGADWAGA